MAGKFESQRCISYRFFGSLANARFVLHLLPFPISNCLKLSSAPPSCQVNVLLMPWSGLLQKKSVVQKPHWKKKSNLLVITCHSEPARVRGGERSQ